MSFEQLQDVWRSQKEDGLFALNEAALFERIRRKGKSVRRGLDFLEGTMVVGNFFVAVMLLVDAWRPGSHPYQFALAAVYLVYVFYALNRRRRRHGEEERFEPTMLGELDKALWRLDYLIKQGRSIIWRYVLPLTAVIALSLFFNPKPWWVVLVLALLLPLSYFGPRWEINKWYLPKKRALEALREQLTAPEPEL